MRNLPRRLLPSNSLLSAFEAVCRTGTTIGAARELMLTQGAVSRQVQNLESQLQVQLFRRERKQLIPTKAALVYAKDVRKALELIARSSLSLRANPDGGTLSLAILPTFGTRWLAPKLPQFLAANPGITINLGTRLERFDFAQDKFDAAIHFGEADWPDGEHMELFPERVLACCAQAFLDRHPISCPQDMMSLPLLHLESRPAAWEAWFGHCNGKMSAARGMLFDQFATMLQAAIHGMGLALLPEFLVAAEIDSGRLVPAYGAAVAGEGSYYLVWPHREGVQKPLQCFQRWLKAETRALRRPA